MLSENLQSVRMEKADFAWLYSFGCSFFAYNWKLSAYSGAFLLRVDEFSFFTWSWSFFTYIFSVLTYSWSFSACSGKVRLISALKNCKQRSLTVSERAPTASNTPFFCLTVFASTQCQKQPKTCPHGMGWFCLTVFDSTQCQKNSPRTKKASLPEFSGRRIGNIAVGRGFVTSSFFRIQVIFPWENSKIQFEFLARKGSREAFFSLCSQYAFH